MLVKCAALDKAAELMPNCPWRIKADRCKVIPGVRDSVNEKWSSDINKNGGLLDQKHSKRQAIISSVGIECHKRPKMLVEMTKLNNQIKEDFPYNRCCNYYILLYICGSCLLIHLQERYTANPEVGNTFE